MGAEREDNDANLKRGGTEPGLGAPTSTRVGGPSPASSPLVEEAGAVDFDALHAALGDPLEFEEHDGDLLGDSDQEERVGESSGASSATYASARPHTIPPTRAPAEDLNAPAVIVASEDTVPSAPPQMTVPLAQPPYGPPGGSGSAPGMVAHPSSGQQLAVPGQPSSGPHPHAPAQQAYPYTPPAFTPDARAAQMTMRMPDRPLNPRRAGRATVVVRPRGPSARQKLLVFMAMLLLVTACGIAVTIWRNPRLFGLEPLGGPTAAPSAVGPTGGIVPPSSTNGTGSLATAGGAAVNPLPPATGATSGATSSVPARPKPSKPAPAVAASSNGAPGR